MCKEFLTHLKITKIEYNLEDKNLNIVANRKKRAYKNIEEIKLSENKTPDIKYKNKKDGVLTIKFEHPAVMHIATISGKHIIVFASGWKVKEDVSNTKELWTL